LVLPDGSILRTGANDDSVTALSHQIVRFVEASRCFRLRGLRKLEVVVTAEFPSFLARLNSLLAVFPFAFPLAARRTQSASL
jgi:hypothetical protein